MKHRRLMQAAIFCLITILVMNLLNFLLWDDIHSLSRQTLTEMYEYDGNIDTVFLGSSYVVHGIDPAVADTVFEENTYNAGTKLQSPDASYYLLKEIIKHHRVKTVYMECNHVILAQFTEPNWGRNSMISVYMKPSLNRVQFTLNTDTADKLIQNWFPFLIKKKLKFYEILPAKLTDGYKRGNYTYVNFPGQEAYMGNGFVYKYGQLKADDNYSPIFDITTDKPLTDFSVEYLEKMVVLCREHGIRLVLFTMPVASEMLARYDNLDNYIDALKSFSVSHDIAYHNYNLVRSSFCSVGLADYSEREHLNGEGARKFSEKFAMLEKQLQTGKLSESDVFYDSLKEKLEKDPDDTVNFYRSHPTQ